MEAGSSKAIWSTIIQGTVEPYLHQMGACHCLYPGLQHRIDALRGFTPWLVWSNRGEQRYVRITRGSVGFLWDISDASEQTNSFERLATSEFLSGRFRRSFTKILRKVTDRNPTITLIVDGQSLS